MAEQSGTSLPAKIIIRFALNVGLVWLLQEKLGTTFVMSGGTHAWVVVGALLTLMNVIVRPILNVIALPLKLFAGIFAVIVVNAIFIQLTVSIVAKMDPEVVTLTIQNGLTGWVVVAIILGIGNWLMKLVVK